MFASEKSGESVRDCKFGMSCYRKNSDHFRVFRHPPNHPQSYSDNHSPPPDEHNHLCTPPYQRPAADSRRPKEESVIINLADGSPSSSPIDLSDDPQEEHNVNVGSELLTKEDSSACLDLGSMEAEFPTFLDKVHQPSQESNISSKSGGTSTTLEYSLSMSPQGSDIPDYYAKDLRPDEEEGLPDLQRYISPQPGPSTGKSVGDSGMKVSQESLKRSVPRSKSQERQEKELQKKLKKEEQQKEKEKKAAERQKNKLEREEQKTKEKDRKSREKEVQKEEALKVKAVKQLEKESQRMVSKNQAEEYVTTIVDSRMQKVLGDAPTRETNITFQALMDAVFNQADIQYRMEKSADIEGKVTWKRRSLSSQARVTGQREIVEEEMDQVVVVLNLKRFLDMVSAFLVKKEDEIELQHFAQSLLFTSSKEMRGCDLTLVTVGLEQHKNQHFDGKLERNRFSREVMDALVELEIETGVQYRSVDKVEDLVDLIRGFHRAVALQPAKEKELARPSYQMHGAVEKGMKMDATNRNEAVKDWWMKMLMQFPKVTRERAAAIADKYPSPVELISAYGDLGNKESKEKLLKDIRAAGQQVVLGPVLSKKIFETVMAEDGANII